MLEVANDADGIAELNAAVHHAMHWTTPLGPSCYIVEDSLVAKHHHVLLVVRVGDQWLVGDSSVFLKL